jgi:hypothetical protein
LIADSLRFEIKLKVSGYGIGLSDDNNFLLVAEKDRFNIYDIKEKLDYSA